MTLKAFIVGLPENGSNEFQVRIPYFEGNSNRQVIYSALLCNQPGEYGGYKIGDCVFICFEDTKLDVPIILGKLYTEEDKEVPSSHTVSNLNVTGTINLPANTTIGGYSTVDIFKNYQKESNNGSLDISNLDYDVIGDFNSGWDYDIVRLWEYRKEQEEYCKISYILDDVSYDEV